MRQSVKTTQVLYKYLQEKKINKLSFFLEPKFLKSKLHKLILVYEIILSIFYKYL